MRTQPPLTQVEDQAQPVREARQLTDAGKIRTPGLNTHMRTVIDATPPTTDAGKIRTPGLNSRP